MIDFLLGREASGQFTVIFQSRPLRISIRKHKRQFSTPKVGKTSIRTLIIGYSLLAMAKLAECQLFETGPPDPQRCVKLNVGPNLASSGMQRSPRCPANTVTL